MFEALLDTAAALVDASRANADAGEALKRLAEAALHGHTEHDDLRETVARLEALVMTLVHRQDPPPEAT
jgi:ABC-type transporter Mla subunit MlaD